MKKHPSGLGRGLGALLGEDAMKADTPENGVTYLPVTDVENNAAQPRKTFDPEALAQLAESIRLHGVIQPLAVRKLPSGYYQIIAGERRWRAARMAGLSEVPVIIMDVDDQTAAELAMVENLQREDLNPMEEAAGFRALIDQYHMTQEQAAERVGKSRSAVANSLRLLDLSPEVQTFVEDGKLSAGHARALIPLNPSLQRQAAEAVISGGMSVRQTETFARQLSTKSQKAPENTQPLPVPDRTAPLTHADYAFEIQKELSAHLGRAVRIVTGNNKGRVELDYYDMDDLNALLDALARLEVIRLREGDSE